MKCVVCEGSLAIDVAIIGEQYPSAIYLDNITEHEFGLSKSSLNLSQCTNLRCNLVQLTKPIDLDLVYKHYPYESKTTATMISILSNVVNEALLFQSLKPGDVVLDIGGNDGSLLNLIDRPDCQLINIDAASNIQQEYDIPNYTYLNSKFNREAYLSLNANAPHLIFSVAVFYQLNDPLSFLRDVGSIMNDESVFVLQMTYLKSMYTNNIFDNVVHEHITYFSLQSLMFIADLAGLKVIGASIVQSYGGSLRAYLVRRSSSKMLPNLDESTKQILVSEKSHGTESMESLSKFGKNFGEWQVAATQILNYQFERYGPIIGMGASTKGNMLLQALGVTSNLMPFILDNNPKKIGTKTTGSSIPIVDEDEVDKLNINIFSLPYYYDDFFKKILQPKISKGEFIDFISPLPKPNVTRIHGDADAK